MTLPLCGFPLSGAKASLQYWQFNTRKDSEINFNYLQSCIGRKTLRQLCFLTTTLVLFLVLFYLSIELGYKPPKREHQSNPFLCMKTLFVYNNSQTFRYWKKSSNYNTGQQRRGTKDNSYCSQEEKLPHYSTPHQHNIALSFPKLVISCFSRNHL